MKTITWLTMVLFNLLIVASVTAQTPTLIAWYPLTTSALDVTQQQDPMYLLNTPFQDGGIYCNGVYSHGNQPDSCNAITPVLPGSIFKAFSVSVKFKVSEIPSSATPVLVGGEYGRWTGIYLMPNGTVELFYNNINYSETTINYQLNAWNEATVTYDSAMEVAQLYLNGVLATTKHYTIDHYYGNLDATFGITNFGNGNVFKGIISDLKIYSSVIDPATASAGPAFQKDPDQFSIKYKIPYCNTDEIVFNTSTGLTDFDCSIYNMLGQKVYFKKISNGIPFSINKRLTGGVYHMTVSSNKRVVLKSKMLIQEN